MEVYIVNNDNKGDFVNDCFNVCVCDVQVVPAVTLCVLAFFCSVFKTCLPTGITHFNIWNIWKAPGRKQSMSNFASLSLCLLVVFGIMFTSTCLMLATMDKNQDNSQANNNYREHLQTITLMNSPKEMVPLSSALETSKPVNVVEMMLLSSAALFTPVTWFLEFLVRLTRKETKKGRSFPGSVCYPKALSAQQPSPTGSLTDIFVDSLKERVEVIRKKRSSGSLPQLRSESVLSIPLTNTSYEY